MMKFVENPNLPHCARAVIVGESYVPLLRDGLESHGIEIIPMPDNPYIDSRLKSHADLSVLHMGGEKLCLAPYLRGSEFAEKLESSGAKLYYADIIQSASYPHDAQLNMCLIGKHLIYSDKTAHPPLVNHFTIECGYEPIESRQGYSRCSVCVVDKAVVITADKGISAASAASDIDVLQISPGHIELPGFDYGFIGGASFKLSDNCIAFTGTLDEHPDREVILTYFDLHNINIVYITSGNVFDIGSVIPIFEK